MIHSFTPRADLGEDDLAWLDRMMESSTTDMDPMCHVALPLPDLLPELPTPTYSPVEKYFRDWSLLMGKGRLQNGEEACEVLTL